MDDPIIHNLTKIFLDHDATIKPIFINSEDSQGTGLCNISLFYNKKTNELFANLRNVEYALYHAEGEQKFQSAFEGPLSYYHPDDDLTLRTTNFWCILNPDNLSLEKYYKVDTTLLDTEPKWTFIGLEDGRIVYWDDIYYLCGVRRDTTPNGKGRVEMSQLEFDKDYVKEIKRNRIECIDTSSYCEKNWMPIKDKPYHFIKWTNPTEVVKINLDDNTTQQIHMSSKRINLPRDLRGGSQLIPWDNDTYLAIVHEVEFIPKNNNGHKDGDYYHRFVIWNKSWDIIYLSKPFNFMTAKIEFCIGLEQINTDIIIGFGFQDNSSYFVKINKEKLQHILSTIEIDGY